MRNMFLPRSFPLLLLAILFTGFTGNRAAAAPAPRTVKSTKGYTITLPAAWLVQPQTSGLVDLIATVPEAEAGDFRVNINVIVDPLQQQLTAQEYLTACKKTMQAMMKDFSEDHSGDFLGNGTCWKMAYNFSAQGDGVIKLKDCLYVFTTAQNGYVITGSATPQTFARYEPIFDQIARSFTLTTPTVAPPTKSKPTFTMDIPPEWTKIAPTSGMIALQAVAPQSAGAGEVKVNINVVVEPLENAMTLQEYYTANKQMMQAMMPDFGEDKAYDFTGDGTCWKMVYHFSTQNHALKNCLYLLVKNKTGYCITATATPETFAKYAPIFDRIVRSFRVTQ